MKLKLKSLGLLTIVGFLGLYSCKDDLMDPLAGGQKNPLPEPVPVDPAYANAPDPTLAKDGDNYYILSSNATLEGFEYEKGLMVRKTTDLVNMKMTEGEAYVLSGVVDGWAKARILTLDETADESTIKIGQPCLRKVGDTWRLYYSVAGGAASVIGYATSASAAGPWEDKGEILSSSGESAFKAISPSFCASADGTSHVLVFGGSKGGIFLVQLDVATGLPSTSPTLVASNENNLVTCDSPELFYYGGYYHLLFSFDKSTTYHVVSTAITGPYADYSGRSAINRHGNFLTRAFGPYQPLNGTAWGNIEGFGVLEDEGRFWTVNHALASGSTEKTLHVRKLDWQKDPRRLTGASVPLPCISVERYGGDVGAVGSEDIVGDWNYETIWYRTTADGYGIIQYGMTFNADGTYGGGKWEFDPVEQILQITSTEWGNEKIYLKLSKVKDWDNDMAISVVATGFNDTFGDYPGAFMKKVGTVGGGGNGDEHRAGFYSPTLAYENGLYYLVTGNAAFSGDYERGLVIRSAEDVDLIEYGDAGYVLSGVIDSWAGAKLKELGDVNDEATYTIDQPCLRKAGGVWRLYYTVNSTSDISVIGYAEAASLSGAWTDKGFVIGSDALSGYKAVSPSFCASPDNNAHYLAFGDNGIYVVQLDVTTGATMGNPTLVISQPLVKPGNPEMFYANGTYNIYYSIFDVSMNQCASLEPMGPYYSYGNRSTIDILEWWTGRILNPYKFKTESEYKAFNNGIGVCEVNGQHYVVHQGTVDAGTEPKLFVRQMNWLNYIRPDATTNADQTFPAICPMKYVAGIDQTISETDIIASAWHYGTLWRTNGAANDLSNPIIQFAADGTIGSGIVGTWDYNATTHILHIVSTSWGGEQIYTYVWRIENEDGSTGLAASGINHTFADKTGVWMKQGAAN